MHTLCKNALVATTVRRRVLPSGLGDSAAGPHRPGRPWLQHHGAQITLLGIDSRVVRPSVERLVVGPTGFPARVEHGCPPWRAPRVVLEDVLRRARRRVLVEAAVFGVVHRRLNALQGTVVPVGEARALSVALAASNGASLAEPEAALPAVAKRLGAVGALTAVRLNPTCARGVVGVVPRWQLRVNSIARRRHDQRRVARDQANQA